MSQETELFGTTVYSRNTGTEIDETVLLQQTIIQLFARKRQFQTLYYSNSSTRLSPEVGLSQKLKRSLSMQDF
jgi:hypothetical protein